MTFPTPEQAEKARLKRQKQEEYNMVTWLHDKIETEFDGKQATIWIGSSIMKETLAAIEQLAFDSGWETDLGLNPDNDHYILFTPIKGVESRKILEIK